MSACTCSENRDDETGVVSIHYCDPCAAQGERCECGCDCGQCLYTDTPCDQPEKPCRFCVMRRTGLRPVGLETIHEAQAEAAAEAERDRQETAALWSDEEEEPLPLASIEFAAEAAAFAAKALPILETYAAHHGLEAALAFGGRLSASPPAATMGAACQEIEVSAKRNLEALSTAFGRDTATAWLDREVGALQEKEKEKEEKAWYCRASLMAMSGRGHY